MDMFSKAYDLALEAHSDLLRADIGAEATPEQKLAIAQIYATLAVAQNLAAIHRLGLNLDLPSVTV